MGDLQISEKDNLVKGDRIRLTFQAAGLFRSAKRFLLIQRLRSIQEIRIDSARYTPEELIVEATVTQNPLPVALLVGSITGIALSMLIYLSLTKVEKIIESPAGALAVGGIGAVLAALAAALILPKLGRAR